MVISGRAGHEDVFKALELGAVDFVAKPTMRAAPELGTIRDELLRKVHAMRDLRIDNVRDRVSTAPALVGSPGESGDRLRVVAIGSSTGGPAALMQILSAFSDPPRCGIVVSQHMPEGFTRGFAERLDRLTPLSAREAEGGEEVAPGQVLIAAGGSHLEFESRGGGVFARLAEREESDRYAPSVDRMFESAAKHFGQDLLAIVLTGMGDDGCKGVRMVSQCGGRVVAESEDSAVVFGMPEQAIGTGVVDAVLPLSEIAAVIQSGRTDGAGTAPRGACVSTGRHRE
jgi:two-component system chemotaxis response regulator CheB